MRISPTLWPQADKEGKHNIKIYIYLNGKKKYLKTDIHIEDKFWNDDKKEVKKSHHLAKKYNAHLKARINEIERLVFSIDDLSMIHNPKYLNLRAFTAVYIEEIKAGMHNLSSGTLKNYNAFLLRISQYENEVKKINFNDVDQIFYNSFKRFLMEEKGNGLTGFSKHIKILKKIMRVGEERNLHSNREYLNFKRFRSSSSNKIYLTEKEIEKIENLSLEQFKELEFERNRFLISYYFLMRFSDSTRITKEWIINLKGQMYIQYKQGKTGTNCMIPVSSKALNKLQSLNYSLKSDNSTANKNIKKICALAGIDQIVSEGDKIMPKWFFVATHTARRSAATNLALSGVSLKIIADLGGWKDLTTLRLYLRSSALETAILASNFDFFK